jgi:hypothetical protein
MITKIFIQNNSKKYDLLKPILLLPLDFEKGVYLIEINNTNHRFNLLQIKERSIFDKDQDFFIKPYKYRGIKGKLLKKIKLSKENLYDSSFISNLRDNWKLKSLTFNLLIEV